MIFKPTFAFMSVTDIKIDFLTKHKINGLILDLDNTLTTHDNPVPADKVTEWIDDMKKNGIKMMIVSNNTAERVTPFARNLGLDFVSHGRKPLTYGFTDAQKLMNISFDNIAIVGDQIFTDIVGANFKRIKTIYVKPILLESTNFFKFKRFMERPFLRRIKFGGE